MKCRNRHVRDTPRPSFVTVALLRSTPTYHRTAAESARRQMTPFETLPFLLPNGTSPLTRIPIFSQNGGAEVHYGVLLMKQFGMFA